MPVPAPSVPAPFTWLAGQPVSAPMLRSDILNAVTLLTSPPAFSGAQTGAPASFTASFASPAVFTAVSTSYTNGQSVVLSGGSLPGNFSAGTVYYVVNAGIDGPGTFELDTTPSGSGRNSSSTGSGTIAQTQLITTAQWANVNLDTQNSDPYGGHLLTANLPLYYGMFPGWYLAEFAYPINYTGGAGTVSAGIYATQGTGAATYYGGGRVPNSGTSGQFRQPTASKLLQFTATGTYGAVGGNYAAGAVYQDSGSSTLAALATTTRYPQLNLEWVSTLTSPAPGTALPPVPDVDSWPFPPRAVGRTFLNKEIRDAIAFLAYRPICEAVYNAGVFSLASQASLPATGTTVPLDTTHVDTYGQFNTGTGVWTCLRPGVIEFHAQVAVNAAATSVAVAAGLTIKSGNYNSGTQFTDWGRGTQTACVSGVSSVVLRRRLRLAYGDTVKLAAFQNDSGAHAAVLPGSGSVWKPRFLAIWRNR